MAKHIRMISEEEYQAFLECKKDKLNDEDSKDLELLNNNKIPDDLKLQMFEKSYKRKQS